VESVLRNWRLHTRRYAGNSAPFAEAQCAIPCLQELAAPSSWSYILILSSNTGVGIPNVSFRADLPTKRLCTYLVAPLRATYHAHHISLDFVSLIIENKKKKTLWPESTIKLYRPSYRRLSAKLAPTFADRGRRVVSVTDPYARIPGFLDRSRYFFFQIAPQLYSRGRVDPVPDPLLIRKSGSAGNRTRTFGSVARNCNHYTTDGVTLIINIM
jgi:hypothetical protein